MKTPFEQSKRFQYLVEQNSTELLHRLCLSSKDWQSSNLLVAAVDEVRKQLILHLADMDPTENKQYLPWILREYLKFKFDLQNVSSKEMQEILSAFIKFKRLFSNKDIFSYTLNQLKSQINLCQSLPDEQRLSKREYKKIIQEHFFSRGEAKLFYYSQTTGTKVILIKSYDAAVFYSVGTKWCISDKKHYDQYASRGTFYYILYKKRKYLLIAPIVEAVEMGQSGNYELASAEDRLVYYFTSLDEIDIQRTDIEFGQVLSEIIIWQSLSRIGLHLYRSKAKHEGINYFNCMTRILAIEEHYPEQKTISQSTQFIENLANYFGGYHPIKMKNFHLPWDDVLPAIKEMPYVKHFY